VEVPYTFRLGDIENCNRLQRLRHPNVVSKSSAVWSFAHPRTAYIQIATGKICANYRNCGLMLLPQANRYQRLVKLSI
jgi:hypothetical protein